MKILIDDELRRRLQKARSASRKETAEELLSDLRMVSSEKPLGYLPLSTIVTHCHTTPEAITAEAEARGLQSAIKEGGNTGSGALYIWDEGALNTLLQNNAETLTQASWPTEASSFVDTVERIHAPNRTPLFDLIADAFADNTNPGRLYIEESHIPDSPHKIMDGLRKLGLRAADTAHNTGQAVHELIAKFQQQADKKHNIHSGNQTGSKRDSREH